jgi:hypothetical protein
MRAMTRRAWRTRTRNLSRDTGSGVGTIRAYVPRDQHGDKTGTRLSRNQSVDGYTGAVSPRLPCSAPGELLA